MPNYWIWQKAPLENEFTIQTEPCYDRDNHKVVLTPEVFSGSELSDQLHNEWDEELLLSRRMAHHFMERQARDVTVRDVDLILPTSTDSESWQHITVVGRVQGIDYQRSQFTLDDSSRIATIEHLALNTANIARCGMHIFRLYGFEEWILVSDQLKQQLQAAGIRGVVFQAISDEHNDRKLN